MEVEREPCQFYNNEDRFGLLFHVAGDPPNVLEMEVKYQVGGHVACSCAGGIQCYSCGSQGSWDVCWWGHALASGPGEGH